ncbi:hypothetical protein PRIPAC_96005 [Pristionchus pacificus]|uniref:Uncharacterized protein n=1 Tax=Pristionchus pacificus TaxID=54126 RepID=A0A2A6BDC0_PRIPA|nr:hypothetical protein PRIPAC_96005 [Pristionchus pacificus]|eukprot:PDM63858.1 hypothetical protein PRIPAC_49831 [Pristionchus pacificus]
MMERKSKPALFVSLSAFNNEPVIWSVDVEWQVRVISKKNNMMRQRRSLVSLHNLH